MFAFRFRSNKQVNKLASRLGHRNRISPASGRVLVFVWKIPCSMSSGGDVRGFAMTKRRGKRRPFEVGTVMTEAE